MERDHRMELQYDGTGLHGWAKQDGLPTVEGALELALRTVLGQEADLRVAGRTDAGVHARRQVVSLRLPVGTDLSRLRNSLNALTPPGVAVMCIAPAPAGFDAREDAIGRTYRYFVSLDPVVSPFWSRYCWHAPVKVDLAALQAAATATVGRHDFTAFTPTETEHVFFERLVTRCTWNSVATDRGRATADGAVADTEVSGAAMTDPGCGAGILYLEIEAEAFLRHMVRTLVGTMLEIAQGRRSLEDLGRLLQGATREEAGPTAPALGLFLWDVRYAGTGACRPPQDAPERRTTHHEGKPEALDDIADHRVLVDGHHCRVARLNPLHAKARGLREKDFVRLFNDRGGVICAARLTKRVRPPAGTPDGRLDRAVAGAAHAGRRC